MIDVEDLVVEYPGGPRIGPAEFDAEPGLTLLQGPSGSGKSTILRALLGLFPKVTPARLHGTATIGGASVAGLRDAQRPRAVGWVPQDLTTVTPTPWQEIALPLENAGEDPRAARRIVDEWLERFDLVDEAHRPIDRLSGGQQARVVLAAGLAAAPDCLLLDEPLSQLDASARAVLLEGISREAAAGRTVLAVTHRPELWTVPHEKILLGPAAPRAIRPVASSGDGPLHLVLKEARPSGRDVPPLSLEARAGETLALAGPNGSGKTSLLHLAAGVLRARSGSVRLLGQDPARLSAPQRAERVGLSFQDPAWHVSQDSVWDEVAVTCRRLGRPLGAVDAWLQRFRLDGLRHRHPWDLSGGERQRLAVVTALAHEPSVALLDEPTRGMDAAHRSALIDALHERAGKGLTTLVVTHEQRLADALPRTVRLEAGP